MARGMRFCHLVSLLSFIDLILIDCVSLWNKSHNVTEKGRASVAARLPRDAALIPREC